MFKKQKNKGNMLIIVLSTMFLLVTMGITFLSMSGLETKTVSTLNTNLKAKLAAEAGIDYAVTELRDIFNQSIDGVGTSVWWFSKTSTKDKDGVDSTNCSEEYDNASPYTSLASLHKSDDEESNNNPTLVYYPSFIMSLEDQPENLPYSNISGILGESNLTTVSSESGSNVEKTVFNPMTQYPFTLKVVDTTSQFPINTHATHQQILDSVSGSVTNNDSVTSNNDESSNITDTSAVKIVGKMLDRLSAEIAKMSWYKDKTIDSTRLSKGPLQGLGEEIIAERNKQGGFYSKYDIAGTYGNLTITLEDVADIWNYITVYPTWKQMGESAIYRNIAPYSTSNASYRIEYRCPVNINTASFPVLMAVLEGISTDSTPGSISDSTKTISYSDALYVATNIIDTRKNTGSFKSWTAFKKFFNLLKENLTFKNESEESNFDYKVNLLMANFDPNVHLKESNPDKAVYQPITKTELTSYTTEFCFFPLGQFDITSLGEAFDYEGNVVSSSQTSTVIKIYETIYQTSQYDFECGPKKANEFLNSNRLSNLENTVNPKNYGVYQNGTLTERTLTYHSAKLSNGGDGAGQGYNAFSSGNNLLKKSYTSINDLWEASSKCFGYIMPLGTQLKTGSTTLDTESNYLFCQNFSSYDDDDLNFLPNTLNQRGYPDPNSVTGVFDPAGEESALGYLYADGFYFRPNMKSLYYNIVESNNATESNSTTESNNATESNNLVESTDTTKPNFPALSDSANNNATIMFWFKINNTWGENNDNKEYTVFFSDQVGTVEGISVGIQHEIKFKIEDYNPNSLVRKLTIIIQNSLYTNDSILNLDDSNIEKFATNWNNIPYKMFTQKVIELDPDKNTGIHAQEWYHLAIRFHNGLELTDFSNSSQAPHAALAISGNFYNNSDGVLCNTSNNAISKILDTDNLYIDSSSTPRSILKLTEIIELPHFTSNTNDTNILKEEWSNKPGIINQIKEKLLHPEYIKQNRFYLGTVIIGNETNAEHNTNNVPNMTMDDFRISKAYLQTIDDTNYQPSRYPTSSTISVADTETQKNATAPVSCYSIFQGKMLGDANGTVTSFSWTARETEELHPGDSAHVVSQTKVVAGKTNKTEKDYKQLFKKFFKGKIEIQENGKKSKSSQNNVKDYKHFKKAYSGITWNATLKLKEKESKTKKSGGAGFSPRPAEPDFDSSETTSISIDTFTAVKSVATIEEKNLILTSGNTQITIHLDKDVHFKNESIGTTPAHSGDIESILEWLEDDPTTSTKRNDTLSEKEKEYNKESEETISSTPLNANNTPYVFDDTHKSFIYELVFPTSGSGAIFNGPVIDDVTLIYLLKDPEFLDHASDLIQH